MSARFFHNNSNQITKKSQKLFDSSYTKKMTSQLNESLNLKHKSLKKLKNITSKIDVSEKNIELLHSISSRNSSQKIDLFKKMKSPNKTLVINSTKILSQNSISEF